MAEEAPQDQGLSRPDGAQLADSMSQRLLDAFRERQTFSWRRRLFIGIFGTSLGGAQLVLGCYALLEAIQEANASLSEYSFCVSIAILGLFILVYAFGCLIQGVDVLEYRADPFKPGAKPRLLRTVLLVAMVLVLGLQILWKATQPDESSQSGPNDSMLNRTVLSIIGLIVTIVPLFLALVIYLRAKAWRRRLVQKAAATLNDPPNRSENHREWPER